MLADGRITVVVPVFESYISCLDDRTPKVCVSSCLMGNYIKLPIHNLQIEQQVVIKKGVQSVVAAPIEK